MKIPVLIHPHSEHYDKVVETLLEIRRLQTYFRPYHVEAEWLPNGEQVVLHEDVKNLFYEKYERAEDDKAVILLTDPIDGFYSYSYRYLNITTTNEWEDRYSPPPLIAYLTHMLAEAFLYFEVDMPGPRIEEWSHRPPTGCFFDVVDSLEGLRLNMTTANLCGLCKTRLFAMNMSDDAMLSVEAMLAYVRDYTIGKPRRAPKNVFIGHGRSKVWLQLKEYLRGLGLPTDEFNQVSVAGRMAIDRLKEMLDGSCFAFLVMTAEDERGDEKFYARQNVVHEIGLFQGRLGFDRAIILKEATAAEFSNIHGLTFIEFPKGRLNAEAKGKIRAALSKAGLVD